MEKKIIIGLGTGRCGTLSLANLFDSQPQSRVFHELRPLLPWDHQPPQELVVRRIQSLLNNPEHSIVGDVASFYLPYAELILNSFPESRFVCLRRDREETIRSFCRWIDLDHPIPTNHWVKQPSSDWNHDPVWSQIFPHYEGVNSREGAIGLYWDEYYQKASLLEQKYPDRFRIFELHSSMNTTEGLTELLDFSGIPRESRVMPPGTKGHSSIDAPPVVSKAHLPPHHPARCIVLVPYQDGILQRCEAPLKELERQGYAVWRKPNCTETDFFRSRLATDALLRGFEETMWINPNIGFNPDAVMKLRKLDLPLTCGIYPKVGQRGLECDFLPQTEQIVFGNQGGPQEILYAGAGFLHVRRQVYEVVQQNLKLPLCDERFQQDFVPFFQPLLHTDARGTWYLKEAQAFCYRARLCGYKVIADTSIRLWHLGTYSYTWEDAGIEQERFANFQYKL